MASFVKSYQVSPTQVYNTGRKATDKRYVKPVAPFFFEKISSKQAKMFKAKPTAKFILGEGKETYQTTCVDAKRLGDNNMCGVIAAAVATNTMYDKCYDLFKDLGRKHGKGVSTTQIRNALDKLGFSVSIVPGFLDTGTMSTIHRRLDETKTYLVFVRGHVACVKGGVVHDWTAGRKHRVRHVMEVNAR